MKKKKDGLWVSLKSKKTSSFFVSFSPGLEGEIKNQRVFLHCLALLLQRQEEQTVQSRSLIWTKAVYQINPLEELPGLPPVCWITGQGEPAGQLQFLLHTKGRCVVNISCGISNMEEKRMHLTVNMPPSPCYLTGTCPDTCHHVHLARAQVMCWVHNQFDPTDLSHEVRTQRVRSRLRTRALSLVPDGGDTSKEHTAAGVKLVLQPRLCRTW